MKNFTDIDEITEGAVLPIQLQLALLMQNQFHNKPLYKKLMHELRTRLDDVRIALFYFGAATAVMGGLLSVGKKAYELVNYLVQHGLFH